MFSHLPCSVMVTQRPLEALFMVRVHVGQKEQRDTDRSFPSVDRHLGGKKWPKKKPGKIATT